MQDAQRGEERIHGLGVRKGWDGGVVSTALTPHA